MGTAQYTVWTRVVCGGDPQGARRVVYRGYLQSARVRLERRAGAMAPKWPQTLSGSWVEIDPDQVSALCSDKRSAVAPLTKERVQDHPDFGKGGRRRRSQHWERDDETRNRGGS